MAPLHPAAEKIARMGAELDGLRLPPGVTHTGEPSLSNADAVLRTLIVRATLQGDGSGVEVRFKVSQSFSTSPVAGVASGRHYHAGEVVRVPVEAADFLTYQKIAEIVTAARA